LADELADIVIHGLLPIKKFSDIIYRVEKAEIFRHSAIDLDHIVGFLVNPVIPGDLF